jgi:hypothetical protein
MIHLIQLQCNNIAQVNYAKKLYHYQKDNLSHQKYIPQWKRYFRMIWNSLKIKVKIKNKNNSPPHFRTIITIETYNFSFLILLFKNNLFFIFFHKY